jgi:DNA primase large subunit
VEEALIYWKVAFSARYSDDQFQKNYAYNVRHNYGQEGKRANYSCYSCQKIINANPPGPEDRHGCPYRHVPTTSLSVFLAGYSAPGGLKLSSFQIDEVLSLSQRGHYQLACTKTFEFSRKIDVPTEPFLSPVQFYERSMNEVSGNKQ